MEPLHPRDYIMKYDPATGEPNPYPSHAAQWRYWNGEYCAWLFNPWTGILRSATDVGQDLQGHGMDWYTNATDVGQDLQGHGTVPNLHKDNWKEPIDSREEPEPAVVREETKDLVEVLLYDGKGHAPSNSAPLSSVEARYLDLLKHLGVMGHHGAIAEIAALRKLAGFKD
jgi:hypothetical protein